MKAKVKLFIFTDWRLKPILQNRASYCPR